MHDLRTEDIARDGIPFEPEPLAVPQSLPRAIREARQDRSLAAIAGLLGRAAEALDPVSRIVVNRLLAFLGLLMAGAMTYKGLVMTPLSWQQVTIEGMFLALCAWLIKRSGS